MDKDSDPFAQLSEDARVPTIDHVDFATISPLGFYRRFVAQSQPVILTNACDQWPALQRWSNAYLRQSMGTHEVSVNVTPRGHGDVLVAGRFVKPEERRLPFARVLDAWEGVAQSTSVFYISHQNGSFASEFGPLHEDISPNVDAWGTEVFGAPPEAVNLWLGDNQAVSSMHKDYYENLYAVMRGQKLFTLLPPWDAHLVPVKLGRPAHYVETAAGHFDVVDEVGDPVPWISEDPDDPSDENFRTAQPLEVVVEAGEVLYLPSLWYHKVTQCGDTEGLTAAVNYWFDMEYGPLYHYFQFVQGMARARLRRDATDC